PGYMRYFTLYYHMLFSSLLHATATPQIYTLSLHDALPISASASVPKRSAGSPAASRKTTPDASRARTLETSTPLMKLSLRPSTLDRKSTRLNSSHVSISYAVFCLKKKKKYKTTNQDSQP